jgi:hypothetical protein
MKTSLAVRNRNSPCSVSTRPRAWRLNSGTPTSCSSAETWRLTADCDMCSASPAWVKEPASAAAWKTRSLSQSSGIGFSPSNWRGLFGGLQFRFLRRQIFSASSAAMQPIPAAVTACR